MRGPWLAWGKPQFGGKLQSHLVRITSQEFAGKTASQCLHGVLIFGRHMVHIATLHAAKSWKQQLTTSKCCRTQCRSDRRMLWRRMARSEHSSALLAPD